MATERITYRDALGGDDASTITVVADSPAERVYRRSAAWVEVSRMDIDIEVEPERQSPTERLEQRTAEAAEAEPVVAPADLAAAYAAAANIGAVKALATSPEAAAALLALEEAAESPRSTLVEWLKGKATVAAPPSEPTY